MNSSVSKSSHEILYVILYKIKILCRSNLLFVVFCSGVVSINITHVLHDSFTGAGTNLLFVVFCSGVVSINITHVLHDSFTGAGTNLLFVMPPAFRRERHYVFGLSIRPSVRSLFPPVHGSVGPSDQLWPFCGMSVRPSVCPPVWRGLRAFARECMEGMAWNFACWCILATFRTD